MSEFERKPDGGLSAWIETYEAMGGGENDAEMLCLLLELRRRRESQTEAERERDELQEQFDKLASAIGWSKSQCEQTGESPFDAAEALKNTADDGFNSLRKAEAELARRDAAAGERVKAVVKHYAGCKYPLIKVNSLEVVIAGEREDAEELAEFINTIAAQPAVLPPEWEGTEHNEYAAGKKDGWNDCLDEALKLGAQPQKVVVFPDFPYASLAIDTAVSLRDGDWIKALDAANVKYEVKK